MAARTKARKRALDILFESELQGRSTGASLVDRQVDNDPPINPYTVELVDGVVANRERLDEVLADHAMGWTLARMPGVDRNLLRIATYEILFVEDVPDSVAVSEAVGLARELSTDDSPGFVNGLLATIVEKKAQLLG
ncbi:transcription antitermination factor NusB [Aeromicrobium sp. IC_218]|uniref:transcription antitermination factor NusB n=1 Tax=Aeromicrobium sp. IC_218 TaxID=2545468 RepID=UPI0010390977|nr:transcription antitermination factor NusB [Aeromicrobium sp. IC_218]TCI99876.1 transcription antitermination factor NusB [Aeromicrobium sp. IC_218]